LVSEIFAGVFGGILDIKKRGSNETIPAPLVIPPSQYCTL
jgi:hypothetical protein